MTKTLGNTDFIHLPAYAKGKVRDIFDCGDSLLIVVSDRISAFDVVFNELIPYKGKVLNSIAAFWFDMFKEIMPNHVISCDPKEYPDGLSKYEEELSGRSMLVKKAKMLPAECIVRGYLEGSALKEYKKTGQISGIKLPDGLKQADRLPEPLFTPSTKADTGHDENIDFPALVNLLGKDMAQQLKEKSIMLYNKATEYALNKGIILADTKFEFGLVDGELTIADEIFTPDSSRFWDLNDYEPGRPQKSFDKQYLRDYLETQDWDKTPPPPCLPDKVIEGTSNKYQQAYTLLTGKKIK